jgi:hypothetical protein
MTPIRVTPLPAQPVPAQMGRGALTGLRSRYSDGWGMGLRGSAAHCGPQPGRNGRPRNALA